MPASRRAPHDDRRRPSKLISTFVLPVALLTLLFPFPSLFVAILQVVQSCAHEAYCVPKREHEPLYGSVCRSGVVWRCQCQVRRGGGARRRPSSCKHYKGSSTLPLTIDCSGASDKANPYPSSWWYCAAQSTKYGAMQLMSSCGGANAWHATS